MKKISLVFVLIASLLSTQSRAASSLLSFSNPKGNIQGVDYFNDAIATIEGQAVNLTLAGAGLRFEPVLFVNVPVYVGTLYLSDESKFIRNENEALASIDSQSVIAIQMSFVHSATIDDQIKAYNTSFDANGILVTGRIDPATKKPVAPTPLSDAVKAYESAIKAGGQVNSGQNQIILFKRLANGNESVIFQDGAGIIHSEIVYNGQGLIHAILTAWLGTQPNSGVEAIKQAWITKP